MGAGFGFRLSNSVRKGAVTYKRSASMLGGLSGKFSNNLVKRSII
jgi:hypothetical protein